MPSLEGRGTLHVEVGWPASARVRAPLALLDKMHGERRVETILTAVTNAPLAQERKWFQLICTVARPAP
eukprot:6249018-Lingulodinium_polyedra.AAC.1